MPLDKRRQLCCCRTQTHRGDARELRRVACSRPEGECVFSLRETLLT
jgi:hypothetical protein